MRGVNESWHGLDDEFHVFLTACGSRLQAKSAMATLRSIVLTSTSRMRAHVHITHDNSSMISKHLLEPLALLKHHAFLDPRRVRVTHKATIAGAVRNFKLCAMARLLVAQENPSFTGVGLYMDTDAVVIRDISNALQLHERTLTGGPQWCALAYERLESDPPLSRSYTWFGSNGLNSGVMLMNVTGMRQSGLIPFVQNYSKPTRLGDQDLLNAYFTEHPSELRILPCEWNVYVKHTPTNATLDGSGDWQGCKALPRILHSSGPSRTLGTCRSYQFGSRHHHYIKDEPLWCAVRDWIGYPEGNENTPQRG